MTERDLIGRFFTKRYPTGLCLFYGMSCGDWGTCRSVVLRDNDLTIARYATGTIEDVIPSSGTCTLLDETPELMALLAKARLIQRCIE